MVDDEGSKKNVEDLGANAGELAGKGVRRARTMAEATLKQANKATDEGIRMTKEALEASNEMADKGLKRMEEVAAKNIERSRKVYVEGGRCMDETMVELGSIAGRSILMTKNALWKGADGSIEKAKRMTAAIEKGEGMETLAQMSGEALGSFSRMSKAYVVRAHHASSRFKEGFDQARKGRP